MTHRPIWTLLPGSLGEPTGAIAQSLEARGLAGIAVPQVYAPPFVALGAIAASTRRIALASGIAMASTRSPFETAWSAIELDRLSSGRFVLGLGVGPRNWSEGFFGMSYDKPVSRLREVIEVVRHVEQGARSGHLGAFDGRFWKLDFSDGYQAPPPPLRERMPIWLAALRESVCELAGEAADGVIGHPVWSVEWSLGRAREAVRRGALRAGRNAADVVFQPYVTASIHRDRREALRRAKPFVAYYAGFAQYRSYFAAHGFGSEADRLIEASRTMPCEQAAPLVPDAMAKTFVAAGTPDDVREWVEPLWQWADSMAILPPGWGLSRAESAELSEAIAATFWG